MADRVVRLVGRLLPPSRRDVALAVLLAVVAEIEVLVRPALRPLAVAVPFALLMTLPLAFRRRAPLAVLVVVMATFPAQRWLGLPIGNNDLTSVVAAIIAIYSAGAHVKLRPAAAGLGFALVCLWLSVAGTGPGGLVSGVLWVAVIAGGAWLAGRGMRLHGLEAASLARLAHALELEQEDKARTAATEERARIARELHDVVAHAVSVMVVQTGAADLILDHDPARAHDALHAVQQSGRQALVELRRLLGVLRTESSESALAPQPGLGELGALAEKVREAGVPVSVRVEGDVRPLPPGLELAAYRIVQEALTNVLKHAVATAAEVALRYTGDGLEVEVIDNGRGAGGTDGHGHGLIGMRERAQLYGGELAGEPRPDGGFAVHARLPVPNTR